MAEPNSSLRSLPMVQNNTGEEAYNYSMQWGYSYQQSTEVQDNYFQAPYNVQYYYPVYFQPNNCTNQETHTSQAEVPNQYPRQPVGNTYLLDRLPRSLTRCANGGTNGDRRTSRSHRRRHRTASRFANPRHTSHRRLDEPSNPQLTSWGTSGNLVLRDKPVTQESLWRFLSHVEDSSSTSTSESPSTAESIDSASASSASGSGQNAISVKNGVPRRRIDTINAREHHQYVPGIQLEHFEVAEAIPPPKLYHYTNQAGAMGILGDRFIGVNRVDLPKLGQGIYFTEIPPQSSTEDIMFNNYRTRDKSSNKISRTEYCFEFESKNIPKMEFCRDPSLYENVKGKKRRNVWFTSLHRLHLKGSRGTYYVRELDGMNEPKMIHTQTWDL